eukprot:g6446.t1
MKSLIRLQLLLCVLMFRGSIHASITDELEELRYQSEHCFVPEKLPGASALAGGLCVDPMYSTQTISSENNIRTKHIVETNSLPTNFFWGNIHGVNYLTVSRNQHIPQYCGSCWAFGTTSAVGDRIKIMRRNEFPEINLAPQVLINCGGGGTCNGGFATGVYTYLKLIGLPDETCQNYQAKNGKCKPNGYCVNCTSKKKHKNTCQAVDDPEKYFISEYGQASASVQSGSDMTQNTIEIQKEIYERGPVACTMYATDEFDKYTGGIYSQFGFWFSANHIVSLVGWGEENGNKYWIGRNSWGTYWGENGFFRIARGNFFQSLGIERGCSFGIPIIPDHLKPEEPLPENIPYGEYLLKYHAPKTTSSPSPTLRESRTVKETTKDVEVIELANKASQKSKDYGSYDIRNITGVSYATVNRNQNNPRYCECSWAQAATSALNDRFALLRDTKFPEIVVSVQVLLNCAKDSNPCHGGSPDEAYAYIEDNSIPDESCSPYEAKSNNCTAIETCKNCWPTGCYSMKKGEYTPYEISAYGKISGADAVVKEVTKNGPVACKISYSSTFVSYTGGIYHEKGADKFHGYVVLSGWGEEDNVPYWIGRNSWGTYWGEDGGWFRVKRGKGDLGITNECYWATPVKPTYEHLYSSSDDKPTTKQPTLASIFSATKYVV